MRIVATFDPSLVAQDTFNAGFVNGTGRIVVYNESNINLQLSWGSFSTYCPAWTAMLYCISTSNVNINWQQQSTLVSSGAPISQVIVEAFDNNEVIVGTFPAPLVRQTNIGNTVSTAMGGSTSLQNDGNTQTTIIEATPSGAASSTVAIDNEGNVTIKGNNAGTLTTLLQLIAGASPTTKLAAPGIVTEVLGSLLADQGIQSAAGIAINASINANIQLVIGLNNDTKRGAAIVAHSPTQSGDLFQCQDSSFNPLFQVGSSGAVSINTPLTNVLATGVGSAGSVDFSETLRGSAQKIIQIKCKGFLQAQAGVNLDIALPIAFTDGATFHTGGINTFHFRAAGVDQGVSVITVLAASGGTTTTQTDVNSASIGNIKVGFDTIRFIGAAGVASDGWITIIGH